MPYPGGGNRHHIGICIHLLIGSLLSGSLAARNPFDIRLDTLPSLFLRPPKTISEGVFADGWMHRDNLRLRLGVASSRVAR